VLAVCELPQVAASNVFFVESKVSDFTSDDLIAAD
jgi:hypothetical protein